jgi:hypothetical protein
VSSGQGEKGVLPLFFLLSTSFLLSSIALVSSSTSRFSLLACSLFLPESLLSLSNFMKVGGIKGVDGWMGVSASPAFYGGIKDIN